MISLGELAAARARKQATRPEPTQRDRISSALDEFHSAIVDLLLSPDPPYEASKRVGRARSKVLDLMAPIELKERRRA